MSHGIVPDNGSQDVLLRESGYPVGLYDHGGSARGDHLYFITNGTNACKIGRTRDVARRVANLQNANPLPLKVELVLPGMGWQERAWHTAFRTIKLQGEWFRCHQILGRAIDAAERGDEWIATLASPYPHLTDQQWCDRIADLEEDLICALPLRSEAEVARLVERSEGI